MVTWSIEKGTESEQEIVASTGNLDADSSVVRALLPRLNPGNPVRMAAEALLELHCLPRQSVSVLLLSLQHPRPYRWEEQCVAAWTLGRIAGTEEEKGVIQCLRNLAERPLHRIYSPVLQVSKFIPLASAALIYFFLYLTCNRGMTFPDWIWTDLGLLALIGAYVVAPNSVAEQNMWANTRVGVLSALAHRQPLESIPLLINAMQNQTPLWRLSSPQAEATVYTAAARTLNRVLFQMTEAEREMLPSSTVLSLAIILTETSNVPLGMTILKLLIQVGDTRVERILKSMRFSSTRQLRIATAGALPMLQAQLRTQETRKTLLRASDAGNLSSATLLRAASETAAVAPNQLLRATATQNLPPSEQ